MRWRAAALAAVSVALGAAIVQGPAADGPGAPARSFSHSGLLSLPLSAQGPVSAALGGDFAIYRVAVRPGGRLLAVNPAQRLRASFDGDGVRLSSGASRVGLSLRAAGYGGSLRVLAPATPLASANHVSYELAGLQEWYANGPLGLEQGFTVARAPAGDARGPLTLALALSGNLRATLGAGGQSVTLSRGATPVLGYGGLSASDARGRPLHSWLTLSGTRLLVHVDARGARYPLRIDPFIHQGEKLDGSGLAGPYGYIGQSVALSADAARRSSAPPRTGPTPNTGAPRSYSPAPARPGRSRARSSPAAARAAAGGSAKAWRCPPTATPP